MGKDSLREREEKSAARQDPNAGLRFSSDPKKDAKIQEELRKKLAKEYAKRYKQEDLGMN